MGPEFVQIAGGADGTDGDALRSKACPLQPAGVGSLQVYGELSRLGERANKGRGVLPQAGAQAVGDVAVGLEAAGADARPDGGQDIARLDRKSVV